LGKDTGGVGTIAIRGTEILSKVDINAILSS